jgi:exonuclease III
VRLHSLPYLPVMSLSPNVPTNTHFFNFKCLSLNCKGIGAPIKRRSVFTYCKDIEQAHITFLQEVHCTAQTEAPWRNLWGTNRMFLSSGTSRSCGDAIGLSTDFPGKVISSCTDSDGRLVSIHFEALNTRFMAVNIYAPVPLQEQLPFYEQLRTFLRNNLLPGEQLLIGGDFNLPLRHKDKEGGQQDNKARAVAIVEDIMSEFNLIDSFRALHPSARRYTWEQHTPHQVKCRLDYWLISEELRSAMATAKIQTPTGLYPHQVDHRAALLTLTGEYFQKRGPGVWKLNTCFLHREDYIQTIQKVCEEIHNDPTVQNMDPLVRWDYFKFKVRQISIVYGKTWAKAKRCQLKDFQQQASLLETLSTRTDEEETALQNLQLKMATLLEEKAKGAMVRARARWIAQGEKSTKYFMNLEKRTREQSTITQLRLTRTAQGNLSNSPTAILSEIHSFYEHLYTSLGSDQAITDQLIRDNPLPQVSAEDLAMLNKPITPEEARQTIKDTATGKSPGDDGIPVEFYTTFWDQIKDLLLPAINRAFECQSMSSSQRRAVLRLIPKEAKDILRVENWRPISLLNVDYKIVAKLLATRLKRIINSLVHPDQYGFVPGRYIGCPIRMLQDLLEYSQENNLTGLAIQLDIEKAFDTLEWDFMHSVLRAFGITGYFLEWIQTLYTNIES